jgi:hypothetical protein
MGPSSASGGFREFLPGVARGWEGLMAKKMIPREFVEKVLREDAWVHTECMGVADGTDRLGEEHRGVFKYKGILYRVTYTWGNAYYMSEVGEWTDPFPGLKYGDTEIECEAVRQVKVTTYNYEPIDAAVG